MPQTLTKLGIANLALTFIGQKPIAATDTNWALTNEAIKTLAVWQAARLTTLRDHTWKFARQRAALVAATTDTFLGFEYIWSLPTNEAIIRKVFVDSESANPEPIQWAQFHGATSGAVLIATNDVDDEDKCYVEYTYTGEGTSGAEYLNYDSIFVTAFAAQVAFLLCTPLGGDEKKMANLYQVMINKAKDRDAREENIAPVRKDRSSLISSRG